MKLTSTLLVLVSLASLVRAQTATDTWTLWPTANYTNVSASAGVGVIATTNGSSAVYDSGYIYTFMAAPVWTLTTETLADVSSISLEIILAGGTADTPLLAAPTLDFGTSFDVATGVTITPTGDTVAGFAASSYVYTWDVSALSGDAAFNLVWQLNQHTAVSSVTVTQDVSAVPEPSTYAALAGLGTLGFALSRRRR